MLLGAAAGRAARSDSSRGSVDLLYRDEDGRLVVVDYKTDRERRARRGRAASAMRARASSTAAPSPRRSAADRPPRFEIWWLRSGEIEAIRRVGKGRRQGLTRTRAAAAFAHRGTRMLAKSYPLYLGGEAAAPNPTSR